MLPSQLLELQQQLAIAVSSERKKDVMVEQLDKVTPKLHCAVFLGLRTGHNRPPVPVNGSECSKFLFCRLWQKW